MRRKEIFLTILFSLSIIFIIYLFLSRFSFYNNSFLDKKPTLSQQQKIEINSFDQIIKNSKYKISWRGDLNDKFGRTFLFSADKDSYESSFNETFGYKPEELKVTGIFVDLKKIDDSKDFYLTLINPENNQKIISRIQIKEENNDVFTDFSVTNLSKLKLEDVFSESEFLFEYEDENDFENIEKILKPGDVIIIEEFGNINKGSYFTDNNGKNVAHHVVLRRAGGKKQIEREINNV